MVCDTALPLVGAVYLFGLMEHGYMNEIGVGESGDSPVNAVWLSPYIRLSKRTPLEWGHNRGPAPGCVSPQIPCVNPEAVPKSWINGRFLNVSANDAAQCLGTHEALPRSRFGEGKYLNKNWPILRLGAAK